MKFNLANKLEKSAAFSYFMRLANKKLLVEVKHISPGRSLKQNNYLHLILADFGLHFGYTLTEAKQIYKSVNREIYTYSKINRGKAMHFLRSSADLTKEEMAQTIDRFRMRSAEAGYDLPLATDQEWLRQIENMIEESRGWL